MPASSEKTISEASARREELGKEEKLKESLKEETSGLQQEKEVGVFHDQELLTHLK